MRQTFIVLACTAVFARTAFGDEPADSLRPAGTSYRIEQEKLAPIYGSMEYGRLSDDGRHVMYLGGEEGNRCFVLDGRVLGYVGKRPGLVRFAISPDGSRGAYVVERDGKQCVVVDGKPLDANEPRSDPGLVFSPDSRHLAYLGKAGERDSVVVLDGEPVAETSGFFRPWFALSPKSELVYECKRNDRRCLVVGAQTKFIDDGFADGPPVFSENGEVMAYLVQTVYKLHVTVTLGGGTRVDKATQKWYAVVDGQPGPKYDDWIGNDSLRLSADGKHHAYVVRKGAKRIVVVDGNEGPPYDEIEGTGPVLSPTGGRSAYAARAGEKWFVVVDGRPSQAYDDVIRDGITFSRDGKRVAYLAEKDRRVVLVVDGQPVTSDRRFAPIPPVFGPDGKHMAYVAVRHLWYVVVDGQAGPAFGSPSTWDLRPVFQQDGSVEYLARDGKSLCRVRHIPVSARP